MDEKEIIIEQEKSKEQEISISAEPVVSDGYDDGYKVGKQEGFEEGYTGGYADGHLQGMGDGQQAEYDKFWDNFQYNGGVMNYYYAFYGSRWNDENYNPKYDIVCADSTTAGQNLFRGSKITDTKVAVIIPNSAQAAFYGCSNLKTIRKLVVTENTSFSNIFYTTYTVEDITIEGVIGKSISFATLPLTVESMKSIITHLKNYSGTEEGVYTVGFSSDCWEALEADSTAPTGSTWKEYVTSLGWLT